MDKEYKIINHSRIRHTIIALTAFLSIVPMKDRARTTAVAVAFGNISMAKFLMAIW